MSVFDKDRLQFVGNLVVEVKADRPCSFALLVVNLQTQKMSLCRFKLRGITPQLSVFKLVAVPQPHDQCRPHGLPLATERVGDENIWLIRNIFFPSVLRGKNEMPSLRRWLGDAQRMIEERLHQRSQQQFLIRTMCKTLDAGEVEVGLVDVRFQHATDLVRMRAGGANDRSGVTV